MLIKFVYKIGYGEKGEQVQKWTHKDKLTRNMQQPWPWDEDKTNMNYYIGQEVGLQLGLQGLPRDLLTRDRHGLQVHSAQGHCPPA